MVVARYLLLLLMVPGISCSSEVSAPHKGQLIFSNIKVTAKGTEQKGSLCDKFTLTNEQAAVFLKKSRLIDIKALHDKYDYLPCYVKGTSTLKKKQCNWEIRAGGTAEISCNSNNYIMACDDCDDLLKD